MKKLSAVIPLASMGLALSFIAADAVADGMMKDAVTEYWSGYYFGAHFGAGAGRVHSNLREQTTQLQRSTATIINNASISEFSTQSSGRARLRGEATGSEANLFVGYNVHPMAYPRVVFGGQLEGTIFSDIQLKSRGTRYSTSTQVQTTTVLVPPTTNSATTIGTESTNVSSLDELRSMFSFIGRAGMLAAPDTMVYGLVGLTEGHFVLPDSFDVAGGRRGQWEEGVTAGVGVEHKLNEHWSLLAEYRYMHFDIDRSSSTSSNSTQTTVTTSVTQTTLFSSNFRRTTDTDMNFNAGRIGIVYRA